MKKTLIIILGIVLIIVVAGFFYYRTSTVNINISNFSSQGMMHPDSDTLNYSSNMIQLAGKKISEVEIKLNEAKEKDFSDFDLLHRKFLENTINKMDDLLDVSKDNLDKAKSFFEEQNYVEATYYASGSRNLADIIPSNINKILEGRTKEDWNTVTEVTETEEIEKIEITKCGELYYFFFEECRIHCPAQEIEINKLIINEACFNITKIDTNKDMDLSKKYDVRGVPAFVFLDENGCFKKDEGLKTVLELSDWINYIETECLPESEEGEIQARTKNDIKGEPLRDEPDKSQLEDEL